MKGFFENSIKIVGVLIFVGCVHVVDKQFPSPDIEIIAQEEMDLIERSVITVNGESYKVDSLDPGDPSEDSGFAVYTFANNQRTLFANIKAKRRMADVLILTGNINDWPEEKMEDFFENPLFHGELKSFRQTTGELEDYVFRGKLMDTQTQEMVEVSFPFNEGITGAGDTQFNVQGDEVIISGTLGTRTYFQMKDLIANSPEVKTVVLDQIPGSINDFINMHTGFLLRDAGLNTEVLSTSDVNSGGVDLFAAGVKRIAEKGAILGVHSWCCSDDGETADKLSPDDPAHAAQLTYYRKALGEDLGPSFYFFTLNASSFDSVHAMTKEEMLQWNLVTDYIE